MFKFFFWILILVGEDGFEISIASKDAIKVAEMLLSDDKVAPAGFQARDSLRLETGLCLLGNEMNQHITPLEADLMWTIRENNTLNKFIG